MNGERETMKINNEIDNKNQGWERIIEEESDVRLPWLLHASDKKDVWQMDGNYCWTGNEDTCFPWKNLDLEDESNKAVQE